MLHRLMIVAAWILLAFIAYATLTPIEHRPSLHASNTFEHVAAFVSAGVLFGLAYPRKRLIASVIVLGSAVLLELAQFLTPDRHGQVQDAIEKLSGGAVGLLASWAVLYVGRAGNRLIHRRGH